MSSFIMLSIPGLKGPSTVPGFEGQYLVSSFSQTTENTGATSTGTGGAAGKPLFDPISITLENDYTIPHLLNALCLGQEISYEGKMSGAPTGHITVLSVVETTANGNSTWTPYAFSMANVVAKSLTFSSDYQNATIELVYGKFSISTMQMRADGTVIQGVQHGWDRLKNVTWNGTSL